MPIPKEQIPEVSVLLLTATCSDCSAPLEQGALATKTGRTTKCLCCSELDGLEFLPSGDVALTRAAQRLSERKAVVFRFNKSKRRNERQGILVASEAIEAARLQCQADEPERLKKRQSSAKSRLKKESNYVEQFAKCVRDMYPNAPIGTELQIAEHACETGSGRVGRSQGAKQLSKGYVRLAAIAYVRHKHTIYDRLLAKGCPRDLARDNIRGKVDQVLGEWVKGAKTA
jgi:hypothetical protein